MIFFNKKPPSIYSDFSDIAVDMHSHIIPGIDDGAASISDSVVLMNQLLDMGFSTLFTTPHSFEEVYPNSLQSLELARRTLDNFIPAGIILDHSSEYYLDEKFSDNLENGHLVPLPGKRLLVEFSQVSAPLDLENKLHKILEKGYTPVIAHPERYLFFKTRVEYLSYLKSMGAELQLNALSLTGYYGREVGKLSKSIIKAKLIDFIGTDLHHQGQLDELRKVPLTKEYAKLLESGLLKNKQLAEIREQNLTNFPDL